MQQKNNELSLIFVGKTGVKNCVRKPRQLLIHSSLGALYLIAILALPAMACGSSIPRGNEFASSLFVLPAIASIMPYGLPLISIVFVETFILHKRESIPYRKACQIVALANGFYILASFVSFLSLGFGLIFPISLIGAVISAAMCLSFCQRTGYLKNLSKGMFNFLVYLFFIGLSFASTFLATSMNSSADTTFLYAIAAGLLLIGFIFGFVTKGCVIADILQEKRPTLAATVMSMHVGSFPIVAIAYYFMQPRW